MAQQPAEGEARNGGQINHLEGNEAPRSEEGPLQAPEAPAASARQVEVSQVEDDNLCALMGGLVTTAAEARVAEPRSKGEGSEDLNREAGNNGGVPEPCIAVVGEGKCRRVSLDLRKEAQRSLALQQVQAPALKQPVLHESLPAGAVGTDYARCM